MAAHWNAISGHLNKQSLFC